MLYPQKNSNETLSFWEKLETHSQVAGDWLKSWIPSIRNFADGQFNSFLECIKSESYKLKEDVFLNNEINYEDPNFWIALYELAENELFNSDGRNIQEYLNELKAYIGFSPLIPPAWFRATLQECEVKFPEQSTIIEGQRDSLNQWINTHDNTLLYDETLNKAEDTSSQYFFFLLLLAGAASSDFCRESLSNTTQLASTALVTYKYEQRGAFFLLPLLVSGVESRPTLARRETRRVPSPEENLQESARQLETELSTSAEKMAKFLTPAYVASTPYIGDTNLCAILKTTFTLSDTGGEQEETLMLLVQKRGIDGKDIGLPAIIDMGNFANPSISAFGGSAVTVWRDLSDQSILYTTFDKNLKPLKESKTLHTINGESAFGGFLTISILRGGENAIAVWTETSKLNESQMTVYLGHINLKNPDASPVPQPFKEYSNPYPNSFMIRESSSGEYELVSDYFDEAGNLIKSDREPIPIVTQNVKEGLKPTTENKLDPQLFLLSVFLGIGVGLFLFFLNRRQGQLPPQNRAGLFQNNRIAGNPDFQNGQHGVPNAGN